MTLLRYIRWAVAVIHHGRSQDCRRLKKHQRKRITILGILRHSRILGIKRICIRKNGKNNLKIVSFQNSVLFLSSFLLIATKTLLSYL